MATINFKIFKHFVHIGKLTILTINLILVKRR